MAEAEFKNKLNRPGSSKFSSGGFNTKSGTRTSKFHDGSYDSFQGKTKGATKHIKPKG